MCRLAAYIGPDLFLHKLLDEEPHSLFKQSWASEELRSTCLNADGYGFGWYPEDKEAPCGWLIYEVRHQDRR
jgi:glutamine amidotransferase